MIKFSREQSHKNKLKNEMQIQIRDILLNKSLCKYTNVIYFFNSSCIFVLCPQLYNIIKCKEYYVTLLLLFFRHNTVTMSYYTISMTSDSKTFYMSYDTSTTPVVKVDASCPPPKWEVIRMSRPNEYAFKDVASSYFLHVDSTGHVTCVPGRPEGTSFTLPGGLGKSKMTNFSLTPNITLYVDGGSHQVSGKNGTEGQEWVFQQ